MICMAAVAFCCQSFHTSNLKSWATIEVEAISYIQNHTLSEREGGVRERVCEMVRGGPRDAGEQRKARSSHYAMATCTPGCLHGLLGGYIREPSILFRDGFRLRQSHARRQVAAESIPRLQPTLSLKATFAMRRGQRPADPCVVWL